MKRLALALALAACAEPAFAQDQACIPVESLRDYVAADMELNGDPDDESDRGMRGKVELLEQRLALEIDKGATYRVDAQLAAKQVKLADDALKPWMRRAKAAEESRDSWTRSPALWAAIGGVVVGAVIVGLVYALQGSQGPVVVVASGG